MLVLSRMNDESVIIRVAGREIKVEVVAIRGNKVRLGFEALNDVSIHREEVQREIDRAVKEGANRG